MQDGSSTNNEFLYEARESAQKLGLKNVHIGNVNRR